MTTTTNDHQVMMLLLLLLLLLLLMMMMIAHQSSWESQFSVDKANDGNYLERKTPHVVQVPHELPEKNNSDEASWPILLNKITLQVVAFLFNIHVISCSQSPFYFVAQNSRIWTLFFFLGGGAYF